MHAGLHVGEIALPLAHFGGVFVKSVRVRIQKRVARLAIDDAGDQLLELRVLRHERQVRPDLRELSRCHIASMSPVMT